ncbi:uncharacterized protein LOC117912599 isoform X1 [Vitis riparia]|uniref:uncharacterized protein LOC117912599 isoform X1 n=2 Tax=Vitis riparia TaxID=96939 RepID=UPI00155A63DF|nr:uncharacterized protein LOC117912599 isoform X1 [Vitis riparia]
MQMEREERRGSYYNYGDYDYENGNCDRYRVESIMVERDRDNQSPEMSSSWKILPISSCPSSSSGLGVGSIEHQVSKMDTLAGIAIKYGVEVADIKRMNGLVTDLQMFALRTLQIPLPGRHPPSPCLLNGSETPQRNSDWTPTDSVHRNLFETFQSLRVKSSSQRPVSPAMSTLQGYYRLKPEDQRNAPKGFEMAVYRKESAHYLEDGQFSKQSSISNPLLSRVRKCRSLANGFMPENGEAADDMTILEAKEGDYRWNEKLIRRRQKSETDFSCSPEMPLKEDNRSGGGGGFSAITGKGLALRTKAVNRTATDADASLMNPIPVGLGDSIVTDSFAGVRKSSSTSNLQDQDNASFPSIWPTSMWNLKPDLQALSTAAITRPIFDGLPKPITGRKNKAALD